MSVIGVGQLSITNLNDAIVSGVEPINPEINAIWIDDSTEPAMIKKWNGSVWVNLGELDPDLSETIESISVTLGNMANDNMLGIKDRIYLQENISQIIGLDIGDNDLMSTDGTKLVGGLHHRVRQSAINAGIEDTNNSVKNLDIAYTNLANYLNGLHSNKGIYPWNTNSDHEDVYIDVDRDEFKSLFTSYYESVEKLSLETSNALKENIDNINFGGRNIGFNGDFSTSLTDSDWADHYYGDISEIVDISIDRPPHQFAYHVKNTSNKNGGIFEAKLFEGNTANNMDGKELAIQFWLRYSDIVRGNTSNNVGRFGQINVIGQTSSGSTVRNTYTMNEIIGTDNDWEQYKGVFKVERPEGATRIIEISFTHGLNGCVGEFWTTGIQVEIGNRHSDWTVNILELQGRVTNVEFKVTDEAIVSTITSSEVWAEQIVAIDNAKSRADDVTKAMIVDRNETDLFHYDNDLISINGVEPTFDVATVRRREGKFSGGVAVEKPTRNYVQNGSIETDELWEFTQQNSSGDSYMTEGELAITNESDGWKQWQIYSNQGATELEEIEGDQEYTLSFEARSVIGRSTGRFQALLRYGTPSGNVQPLVFNEDANILDNDWKKFHVSGVVDQETINESTLIRVLLLFAGTGTVAFRNVQIEKSPFPTSFIEGSRASGVVEYDASTLGVNKEEGSVSFWATDSKWDGKDRLIGERNLLTNTTSDWKTVSWSNWNEYPNGNTSRTAIEVVPNEEYTFTVEYRNVETSDLVDVGVRIFWRLENGSNVESNNGQISVPSGSSGIARIVTKAPSNARYATAVLRKYSSGGSGRAEYRYAQLELGSKATDWSPAPEDLGLDVYNWSINEGTSKKNLLINSDFTDGLKEWEDWGAISREVVDGKLGKKWAKLTVSDVASFRGIRQVIPHFKPNTKYTISFLVYSTDINQVYFLFHQRGDGNNNPQIGSTVFNTSPEPRRIDYTFTSADISNKTNFNFMIGGSYNQPFEIYLTDLKFEESDTPTPYLPAPQDLYNYDNYRTLVHIGNYNGQEIQLAKLSDNLILWTPDQYSVIKKEWDGFAPFSIRWKGALAELFMNGEKIAEINMSSELTDEFEEFLTLGGMKDSDEDYVSPANAIFDELRIDSYAVSDEEIEIWNNVSRPFVDSYDFMGEIDMLKTQTNELQQTLTSEGITTIITESVFYDSYLADLDNKVGYEDIEDNVTRDELDDLNDDIDDRINNAVNDLDFSPYVTRLELEQTSRNILASFSAGGGMNKIINSIGGDGFEGWNIAGDKDTNYVVYGEEMNELGFGSGFRLTGALGSIGGGTIFSMTQTIPVVSNTPYVLSWYARAVSTSRGDSMPVVMPIVVGRLKNEEEFDHGGIIAPPSPPSQQMSSSDFSLDASNAFSDDIPLYDGNNFDPEEALIGEYGNYNRYAVKFVSLSNSVMLGMFSKNPSNTSDRGISVVTGMMLNLGTTPMQWTLSNGEMYNTNIRMNINGIKVSRLDDGVEIGYTSITPEEFAGYYDTDGTGNFEKVFYLREDETVSKKFRALEEFTMGTVRIVKIESKGSIANEGWAFVPIESED